LGESVRILAVITHYFGPSHPENNLPAIGSYLEPMGRIAALNELIVALKGQFGPDRFTFEGQPIVAEQDDPVRHVDIVVMTMREHNILPQLGFAPGTFETIYIENKPPSLAFNAHNVLRDRLGAYDFYCSMEDDIIIRDPAFFAKLMWFQHQFGPKAVLMPVRFELAHTGTPAKALIDPLLPVDVIGAFRRPGQPAELTADWNGRRQVFQLPSNPHSGCFFLTEQQMRYWIEQPSFGERDTSFAGPLESAVTLSVGKVFDLYKPASPDPFFLEVMHFGARYGAQAAPRGSRFGEMPLLAIAQNAMHAAQKQRDGTETGVEISDKSFAQLVELWNAQGTAVEHRARMDGAIRQLEARSYENDALRRENEELRRQMALLAVELHRFRS
jgi:hypothetical protein